MTNVREKERLGFESWCRKNKINTGTQLSLATDPPQFGGYMDSNVQWMWLAWVASRTEKVEDIVYYYLDDRNYGGGESGVEGLYSSHLNLSEDDLLEYLKHLLKFQLRAYPGAFELFEKDANRHKYASQKLSSLSNGDYFQQKIFELYVGGNWPDLSDGSDYRKWRDKVGLLECNVFQYLCSIGLMTKLEYKEITT